MIWAISVGANRQFTATVTALSLPTANETSKNSGQFLSRNATRSPGPTPAVGERPGESARARVELAEGDGAALVLDGRRMGPLAAVHPHNAGDRRDRHDVLPPCDLFQE